MDESNAFEKGYAEGWMDAITCIAQQLIHLSDCTFEFNSEECTCVVDMDAIAEAGWVAIMNEEADV